MSEMILHSLVDKNTIYKSIWHDRACWKLLERARITFSKGIENYYSYIVYNFGTDTMAGEDRTKLGRWGFLSAAKSIIKGNWYLKKLYWKKHTLIFLLEAEWGIIFSNWRLKIFSPFF